MKLIKLHMVCEKWDTKKGKLIEDYIDLYVNIYHIGSFAKDDFTKNTTNLILCNECRFDIHETPEEILELIREVECDLKM